MSIKVAVRVRPFNTREEDTELIISMKGNSTIIKDEFGNEKTFTFDKSFWSHDQYIEQPNGYLSPTPGSPYADQKIVFDALGKEILDNAWEGYNCCLFAYGQTGSGKSYSMVGYGANKGIVPISCEEVFTRIKSNKDETITYEVEIGMLEIYNEKVQDLFIHPTNRPPNGLKVRESKALGIFVEGLTTYPVESYEDISTQMEKGYENRTIASTGMNATSSRAHTIVIIEFKQITTYGLVKTVRTSKINLVDLAGSERAGTSMITGDRLKEGCNINKSLLVLGNVITILADKAQGKKKDILPPYRDSVLTRILQNALGGNSKTVMICALSPSSRNHGETLSTLRYADRAKKIQNKAIVNESEHDKTVRLLREENNELKKMIEELSQKLLGNEGVIGEEDKRTFQDLKAQYDANEKMFENMQKTFSEKVKEAKQIDKEQLSDNTINKSLPHLVVLNEDPQLSHKLKYKLTHLPLYVGRKHGNPQPMIILSGIGIKQNHAIFTHLNNNDNTRCVSNNSIILKPNDPDAIKYIYINGKALTSLNGQALHHKDKIVFGTNTIMLYMEHSDGKDIYEFDYESVQNELQHEIEIANEKKHQEQLNAMKHDLEEQYIKDKQAIEDKLKSQLLQYEMKIKEMANQSAEKAKIENERAHMENILKQRIEKLEAEKIYKNELIKRKTTTINIINKSEFIHDSDKLENTLYNIVKKIHKLKSIINELNRNIDIDICLTKNIIEHYNNQENTPITITIRVENYEEGVVYHWSKESFINRYDLMKDLYNRYIFENTFDVFNLSKQNDPLYDEATPVILGYAFYKLEPCAYLMNNLSEIEIVSLKGDVVGTIIVDVVPLDNDNTPYDEIPAKAEDLIGESLNFEVYVKECRNLPEEFCRDLQVEYTSFHSGIVYKTKIYNCNSNKDVNVSIEERFKECIGFITKDDIDFLINDTLCFRIYAIEEVEKKGKRERPSKEDVIKSYEYNNRMIISKNKNENIMNDNNDNDNESFVKKGYSYVNYIQKEKECVLF